MSYAMLLRLGGLAAIVAGVLRVGTALVPTSDPSATVEALYLLIDILLLFAFIAIYAIQRAESGLWGLVGFVLCLIGLESIGGPDGSLGGVDVYTAGAALIGVGLVPFAVGTWRARILPRWVPVAWVLSTVIGLGSFPLTESPVPFAIAGIAFGLGFVGAGIGIWSHAHLNRPLQDWNRSGGKEDGTASGSDRGDPEP